jgi:DNA ligase (NAD+)
MFTLDSPEIKDISPSELGELLIKAKNTYYTSGKPIMDDHTYDTLEDLLRRQNPHHRIFSKIGHQNFDTGFAKAKHIMSMGSQNKVSNYPDLVHYFKLKKIPDNTDYVVQPKCDGISLEIIYQNGQMTKAITRGDGQVGDQISQNVVLMQNYLPKTKKTFSGSVRCEIVVTYKDFKTLNAISKEITYSNPRNAASGISQRLDSQYNQFCTLLAVDIFSDKLKTITEFDQIKLLQKLGFVTVESHLCQNLTQVENIFQQFFTKKRADYDYDIDGLVIKINPISTQRHLGFKNGRPKFQVAYKFPPSTTTTTVKDITWQTGPLGTVTPVAKLEPVEVSGAIITFASLGNRQLLLQKKINIGDLVQISRRGDVIPYVEKVIKKINPRLLTPPQKCPSCQHSLITEDKFLRCPNSLSCPAQTLGSLRLFCKFLDIKGISAKTIKKLSDSGKLSLPGDFYRLSLEDFIPLEGLGPKSGQNILVQINAKRNLSLAQVLTAAAIPNFSAKRVRQLINAGFNTPQKILNLQPVSLETLPGFQVTLAEKIIAGLRLKKEAIESILSQVKIKQTHTASKLNGLKFAITGTLSQARKQIETDIESAGAQIVSTVTKNTNYLVCNQTKSNSDKFLSAQKLNIPIISETELSKLLN